MKPDSIQQAQEQNTSWSRAARQLNTAAVPRIELANSYTGIAQASSTVGPIAECCKKLTDQQQKQKMTTKREQSMVGELCADSAVNKEACETA